jgi:ethanolamine utilization protein EutN
MLIARVIGELVATQKHASHEGRKLLLVQPLNLDGSDRGDAVVALDAVDAGVGDRVLLVTEGFSAMTAVGRPQSPIDMAVIGFIDHDRPDAGSRVTAGSAARPGRPPSPPPAANLAHLGHG